MKKEMERCLRRFLTHMSGEKEGEREKEEKGEEGRFSPFKRFRFQNK